MTHTSSLNSLTLVCRALNNIVRADLKYLASEKLLDYSILLGLTTTYREAKGPDPKSDKRYCDSYDDVDPPTPIELELYASSEGPPGVSPSDTKHTTVKQPMINQSTGKQAYCLGMIDILEKWNSGWAAQGAVLKCICTIFGWPGTAHGITAIPPDVYAWRFDEFFQDKILAIDDEYDDWRKKDGPSWKPWR